VATSNSLERAQNFVQSMIIPNKQEIKTYGSYEELLADPECGKIK
jgi:predicted dehydrogenase